MATEVMRIVTTTQTEEIQIIILIKAGIIIPILFGYLITIIITTTLI